MFTFYPIHQLRKYKDIILNKQKLKNTITHKLNMHIFKSILTIRFNS